MESDKLTTNPVARAGHVSHILMRLKRDIERARIKPLLVMGMVPLCSAQYNRLFGTTRIPGVNVDSLQHYSGAESDYCVCCRDGKWFKVSLTSPLGKVYSPVEMERQFQMIWEDEGEGPGPGVKGLPALTSIGRTEWAEARNKYFDEGVNKTSMEIIEKVHMAHCLHLKWQRPTLSFQHSTHLFFAKNASNFRTQILN